MLSKQMSPSTTTESPRRHDVDALRAVAMLLGIVLHAGISFAPIDWWVVQDNRQHEGFFVLLAAIHGFRMPLFFVISGFFTAMLWRKRGLRLLMQQRFQRIFLPLALGLVTIIPLMTVVVLTVPTFAPKPVVETKRDATSDLWTAAVLGNIDAMEAHLAQGADINARDPQLGNTPLAWAVIAGHTKAAEWLLEQGADIQVRDRDTNSTVLHTAVFFGSSEIIERLIVYGADINAVNSNGQTPLDLTASDMELVLALANLFGVVLDPAEVERGWAESAELLRQQQADTSHAGAVNTLPEKRSDELWAVGTFLLLELPILHHLWFLWHLCWLIVGFVLIVRLLERFPLSKLPAWLVLSPTHYLWLIPLTMLPQLFMVEGFGADLSAGLLPRPHVLLYYAIFFGFGALYCTYDDPNGRISQGWWLMLLLGLLVIFPLSLVFLAAEAYTSSLVGSFLQVSFTWLMVFGLMGMFRTFFDAQSQTMRYLSDSSYWLYLAHLPLVIVAQAVVQAWPLPAILKFAIIIVVVTVFLLWTYQAWVRYTWLGTFLNGSHKRANVKTLDSPVNAPM